MGRKARVSDKDMALAREMVRRGEPVERVARRFAISFSSMRDVLSGRTYRRASAGWDGLPIKSALSSRRLSDANASDLRRMVEDGATYTEAATAYGLSRQAVADICEGRSYKRQSAGWSPSIDAPPPVCECGRVKQRGKCGCDRCLWLDGTSSARAEVIHALRGEFEPLTSGEVATRLNQAEDTVYAMLRRLRDQGRVLEVRGTGDSEVLWVLRENARPSLMSLTSRGKRGAA